MYIYFYCEKSSFKIFHVNFAFCWKWRLLRELYSPLHRITLISLICICISVKTKEPFKIKLLLCFSYLNLSPSCLKILCFLWLLLLVLKITLKRILAKKRIISFQENYTWAFIYVCTIVKTPQSITQFPFQLSSLLCFSLLIIWKAFFAHSGFYYLQLQNRLREKY